MSVVRIERGWGAHYCCAARCRFRRNTLIEHGERRIVVSTVGNLRVEDAMEQIGSGRYYETAAFEAKLDGPYWDANISRPVRFQSNSSITAVSPDGLPADVDHRADAMHEAVVAELSSMLEGETPC